MADPTNDFLSALSALRAGGSPGVATDPDEPRVYWGRTSAQAPALIGGGAASGKPKQFKAPFSGVYERPDVPQRTIGVAETKTLSEAKGEFYNWSESERRKWADHLIGLGLLAPEDAEDYGSLRDTWFDVVDETANFTTAGKELDPWDVASLIAGGEKGAAARKAARDKANFTGTKTTTSKSVDLTDPATAKALVNDTLSRQLGRAATDEEVVEFTNVLNNAARANPSITTTATTYEGGEAVGQSSTTSGGVTAAGQQQMIQDEAMATPEYGAYQAAATYLPTLFQAIGSPV